MNPRLVERAISQAHGRDALSFPPLAFAMPPSQTPQLANDAPSVDRFDVPNPAN
jgi:hypothetical protein